MRVKLARSYGIISGLFMLLALSGCFQPAGTGLEATSAAQNAPPPTETPVPPSETPFVQPTPTTPPDELFAPSDTPIPPPTKVLASDTPLPPLPTPFQSLFTNTPFPTEVADAGLVQNIDPLAQTATAIVEGATQTAGAPMTLTVAAMLGIQPATATPFAFQPTQQFPGQATSAPVQPYIPGSDCIHEVRAGDQNLYRISLRYGSTVEDIARASGIVNPNLIVIGQRLTIPGCGTLGVTPPPTDAPTQAAGVNNTSGVNNAAPATTGQTYTVQTGDTLFALSIRFGVTVEAIANANGISNLNIIYIGQQLVIP
jgi:LysM repeat protein